ncbi:MAG: hypothetical protein ABW061_27535, partial [Polyangiaceae bacterium]
MAWGWLLQVGRILGGLLSRPEKVREAVREANEFLDAVDSALHDDPPPQPLPHSAVEEQRRQIDAATSHKVAPADAPPVVVDTRGPGVAKAKERTKKPP